MHFQNPTASAAGPRPLGRIGGVLRRFVPPIALLLAPVAFSVHAEFPLHAEISLGGNAEADAASFIFPTRADEDITDIFLVNNFTRTSIFSMFTVSREPATGYSRLTVTPEQDFDTFGTINFTLVVQTRQNPRGTLQETVLQAETVRDAFPDRIVSPFVKQLADYLKGRVASGDMREADAIAQFAASAQYYGLRPGQIDRLLGLVPGYAKTAFDVQLNPYDWYSFYLNPLVSQSGEVPPTIGALRLLSNTATTLSVGWDIVAPNGLRNLQYSLGGINSTSGQFAGLTASTDYTVVAQAETRNVFLNTWQPVRQTARFSTAAAVITNAPVATNLSAAETYTEQTDLNLVNIVASDVDSANVTAKLTLSNPAFGSLTTATSGSVTSTYVAGTGVWTASGPIADVNTLLADVTFKPTANVSANFTIATQVSDGVNTVQGSKAVTGVASGTTVITSASDTVADDGVCTLREAITASNTSTASGTTPGECNGAHTLIAPAGNVTFSGSNLSLSSNITLRSAGPGLTTLKSTGNGITMASGTISITDCAIDATSLTVQSAASVTLASTSGAASVVLSGALTNSGTLKGSGAISITVASFVNYSAVDAAGNISISAATIRNETAAGDTRTWSAYTYSAESKYLGDNDYYDFPDDYRIEYWHKTSYRSQSFPGGAPGKAHVVSGGVLTLQNFSSATNIGGVLSAPTVTVSGSGGATFNNNVLSLNREDYESKWQRFTHWIALGPAKYDDRIYRDVNGNNVTCCSFPDNTPTAPVLQSTTELSNIGAGVFATTLNAGGFALVNQGAPIAPSL